jgi:hypothetical protein
MCRPKPNISPNNFVPVCRTRCQWVPSAIAGDRLEVQECDAAGLAGAQCDDSFHSPRVVTEVHVSVGNQVVVD